MICEAIGFTEATGFLACNAEGCVCWFDGIAVMMLVAMAMGAIIGWYQVHKLNKENNKNGK